ncbi:MAG TPA: 4Fe-4S dicluster domain-containing protein [Syntrophomonadaceae bacterium]|nr:4Fe-4S dicluster domain-containing protein [Syntrophomonadaceae bacterium]
MSKHIALVIDMSRCVGCRTCTVACKMENNVVEGNMRMRIFDPHGNLHFDRPIGIYPDLQMYWTPVPCQHCEDAPCVTACPSGAMHVREDGIVDLDKNKCIGCRYCNWVCPYDVPQFDSVARVSDKCNLCAHLIDKGEDSMCVTCCPARAIHYGDLNDPNSEVSKLLQIRDNKTLAPEHGTKPSTHYIL